MCGQAMPPVYWYISATEKSLTSQRDDSHTYTHTQNNAYTLVMYTSIYIEIKVVPYLAASSSVRGGEQLFTPLSSRLNNLHISI